MIDGIGAIVTKEDIEVRRRCRANLIAEFERRGTEYAKGYLAARLGSKPLWLARFFVQHCPGLIGGFWWAAAASLEKAEIEWYKCGREFYESLPRPEVIRDEIRKEVAENKS